MATSFVDYYFVMGLARRASFEEVKLAYRRLALVHHPDRNPGEADDGDSFKLLLEAYEVLSDPERRAEYDRDRFNGGRDTGGQGGRDRETARETKAARQGDREARSAVDEIFSGLGENFQNSTYGPTPIKGADLRFNLNVDFASAVFGIRKEIVFQARAVCSACSGTGAKKGTRLTPCPLCFGKGVSDRGGVLRTCTSCLGHGVLAVDECRVCSGEGTFGMRRRLGVNVPPGADTGTRLKIAGEGEPGINGGPPGDLFVVVTVGEHPFFLRQGYDIVCDLPLTFVQAALGGEVEAPTIDGPRLVKVKPGTQHGEVIRLKGAGVGRREDGSDRGDHKFIVSLEVPKSLGARQRELLAEFEALTCGDSLAAQFRRKVRDFFK